jgi:hypothetical protein
VSIRQALPGEHLSPCCGHHCGVRSTADEGSMRFIGHCSCPDCICLYADYPTHVNIPAIMTSEDQSAGTATLTSGNSQVTITGLARRVPMCDSWGTMGLSAQLREVP